MLTNHFIRYTALIGFDTVTFRTALCHRFIKVIEIFPRYFEPLWHKSITQLLEIYAVNQTFNHPNHQITISLHLKGALLGLDVVTVETFWVQWTIRRWVHCVWTLSASILTDAVVFKWYSVGITEPHWCLKISPHTYTHHQPKLSVWVRMDPQFCIFFLFYDRFWYYHLNVAAETKIHQTSQWAPLFKPQRLVCVWKSQ